MDNSTKIVELKFDGNGINPTKVKASEIAELIISYENAITNIIKTNNPEISDDFVFLSIDQIQNQSLTLRHLANQAKSHVLPALFTIASAFEQNNFNQIPNSSIQDLRVITAFTKKYQCDGWFIVDGKTIASFNQDTDVAYNQSTTFRGDTVIYGEIKGVNEKINTRSTIRINNEYNLSFDVSKDIAIQLGSQLFKEVGLRGNARWDKKTYRVIDFRVDSVIVLGDKTISDTFSELGVFLNPFIDKHGDYPNYLA